MGECLLPGRVFRQYDIRGRADEELTSEAVLQLGRALGTYYAQKGEDGVVVCRDNRTSSPRLREALVQGLLDTGCCVIDIGLNPTPVCYFALQHLNKTAGVMVTGSHNPPGENGFKICSGGSTVYGAEIQKIREIAESGRFIKGRGELSYQDVSEDYLGCIAGRVQLVRPVKAAVDAGSGTAGPLARELYTRLGCELTCLYCDPDPAFPYHHPDPTVPANLEDLRRAVAESGAEVGLAFDGDGDRLGAVDERGRIIWGDLLQILFWREILPRHPGTPVIVEVKCSQALVEEAYRLGGRPFFYKTGHSLIKAKMKEVGALFTGEMSGHFFFADEYFGYDDALYAGARLLRLLSQQDRPLSELLSDVPPYVSTPEVRLDCPDEIKWEVVEEVKKEFLAGGYQVIDVDGARVVFSGGWGLLRCSNTQPVVVMRAEAHDPAALEQIVQKLRDAFDRALKNAQNRQEVVKRGS